MFDLSTSLMTLTFYLIYTCMFLFHHTFLTFTDILINRIADKFPGQQIELSLEDFDLDIDTMTLLEFCCDLKSDVTNNLWEMMLDCASREGK